MFIENELTAAQLDAAYQAGQRHFASVEIVGAEEFPSVSNISLNGAEFISCWFHSATFENVDFGRARFVGCNLKCVTFRGCNLSGSSWDGCAVCSLSISTCETVDLEARELDAYGFKIDDASSFLGYAHDNAQRDATP
jgi:uncharacterized protein YjbI with pentapeptide repeats